MRTRLDRVKLISEMARQEIGTAELAEKSGISRSSITALRSGKSCNETTARCIADALGVPMSALAQKEESA